MLLYRDNLPAFTRCTKNELCIERLDRRHIDHTCADSLGRKTFSCLDRLRHENPCGNDRDIRAILQHLSFANDKRKILRMVDRRCCTSEADVDRTIHLVGSMQHFARLHIIRRAHDRHAGDRTHESKILTALMRCTIFADGDAAVRGTDLDVQMRVSDRIAHLLIGTPRRKHGKRRDKRHEAHGRQTCADIHQIALCNTTVEVTVRERLLKDCRLGCTGKIRIQHDDVIVFFS